MTPPTDQKHICLYRYLKADYAVLALRNRELRVSRLSGLNDPFEFTFALPYVHPTWPHSKVDEALGFLVRDFDQKFGIISFSAQITDPVIWSHYSDSHQGIALGFDVNIDDTLFQMRYPATRPTVDVQEFSKLPHLKLREKMREILSAKAPSWSYEVEYRVFVDLASSRKEGSDLFHDIPENCLKHVVLGMRCKKQETELREILSESNYADVRVSRARRCHTHFRVLCD